MARMLLNSSSYDVLQCDFSINCTCGKSSLTFTRKGRQKIKKSRRAREKRAWLNSPFV